MHARHLHVRVQRGDAGALGRRGGQLHGRFAQTLFAGLILYNLFSETLSGSAGVVAANPSYVKRVVFPLELLPVTKLCASLVHALIGLGLLVAATLLSTGGLPLRAVLLPVVFVPLLMWALGLAWLVAALAVYLRDLAQVLAVALNILVFMTPIFYPPTAVPPRFRAYTELNPLTTIVDSARRVLLWDQSPDWTRLALITVVGALVMQLGFAWFMVTKKGFADVL